MTQLALQFRGHIDEWPMGPATVLLSRDEDAPNEFVLYWWLKNEPNHTSSRQALFEYDPAINGFNPTLLFSINERLVPGTIAIPAQELEYLTASVIKLTLIDDTLQLNWQLSGVNAKNCTFLLISNLAENKEFPITLCEKWADFRDWANSARDSFGAAAYRGHGSQKFKLQTTLSRAGRTRIDRYEVDTLRPFQNIAEVILDRHVSLSDGQSYTHLLGLAQHHGLPTPLLDWTRSPYIASYFAFSDALENARDPEIHTHVRIYALSGQYYRHEYSEEVVLPTYAPFAKPLSISALGNPRLHAQQGIFLATNVVDLEQFLTHRQVGNVSTIMAADIPIKCMQDAMKDLEFMGITANSLFPGLDGACRHLKQKMLLAKTNLFSERTPEEPR